MIEGSLASQQLVGENSKAPKVYCHVVLHPFKDLRSNVVERTAVSLPSLGADSCPTKVANLIHVLNNTKLTLLITIF